MDDIVRFTFPREGVWCQRTMIFTYLLSQRHGVFFSFLKYDGGWMAGWLSVVTPRSRNITTHSHVISARLLLGTVAYPLV